jgi:hypothetical protein
MGMLGVFLAVLMGLVVIGVVLDQLDLVDLLSLGNDIQARNVTLRNNNNNTQVSFALKPNVSYTSRTDTAATSQLVRETRIIYLHHIHKAGGSILCAAAQLNGLKVNFRDNCNVQANQQCCGNQDSLQAQQEFARTTRFNFVANEADLIESIDPQNYRYVIQLRNSQQRYKSHWKHVIRAYSGTTTFSDWWAGQPDNWTVRKICGSRCHNIAKFNISRELFEYSLKRLHVFDDILLLENFQESFVRFTTKVGWKPYIPKASTNQDSWSSDAYPPLWNNTSWDVSMTALDNALYQYALQLYHNDTTRIPVLSHDIMKDVELYFQQGPSRGCTTPCCSQECSKYRI